MSPKTGLNDKENNMKTNNQLDNEKLNQNSTVDQTKLENGLKFKLNLEIKDQLIIILNKFTSLMYSGENKDKVIEKSNNLLHNLIDLPLKIDHTEENEINSSNSLFKPTLLIDYEMKSQIIDLLFKNKVFSILLKDNKDAKSDLINQNNNLVIKLMQFPLQMLKVDDTINNDFVWKKLPIDNSNYTDDQLVTKSESDKEINELKKEISILKSNQFAAKSESDKEINELKEKISILNDQSTAELKSDKKINELNEKISILKDNQFAAKSESDKEINELRKEISILKDQLAAKSDNQIDNFKDDFNQLKEMIYNPKELFIKRNDSVTCSTYFKYKQSPNDPNEITTLPFECLGLEWIVKMKILEDTSSNSYNCYFELILISKLDSTKKIKANCELILLNKIYNYNKNQSLKIDLVFTQDQIFKTHAKVFRNTIRDFYRKKDNILYSKVNLTVELISKEEM